MLNTLTGPFIRYTLLVPGWTLFCLQNCLNYSWHRFNKVLETFLRDFGPYWHDSITQLLQICQLHIHDANLSCSRNQSEMIWALWHGALSCWKKPSEDKYTVVKKRDGHGQQLYSGRLWCLNDAQLVIRGPKCAKKISHTPLHHHHQPEPLRQGRMDPCFHILYAIFWPYHLNIAA